MKNFVVKTMLWVLGVLGLSAIYYYKSGDNWFLLAPLVLMVIVIPITYIIDKKKKGK